MQLFIETSTNKQEMQNFVDCETKRCFISQRLAIDTKFVVKRFISKRIQAIDERSILFFDKHLINITVKNNNKVKKIVQKNSSLRKCKNMI